MTKFFSKLIKLTLGAMLIFSLFLVPIATYESGIEVTSIVIPEIDD